MNSQRVSLQELNQADNNAPIASTKSVNQSQSDSNLQKLKKKTKKVFIPSFPQDFKIITVKKLPRR